MTKGVFCVASLAWLALSPLQSRHSGLATAQSASPRSSYTVHPGASDSLVVILLGTGAGPNVNLKQFGAGILVVAGYATGVLVAFLIAFVFALTPSISL